MTSHKRDTRVIRSLVIKIVAVAACIVFASVLSYCCTEYNYLNNDVVMGQLENSNEWFVIMSQRQNIAEAVRKVAIVTRCAGSVYIGWCLWRIRSTLKLDPDVDNKTTEEE